MQKPSFHARSLAAVAYRVIVLGLVLPAHAEITNRWSFNNPATSTVPAGTAMTDSVSGTIVTVRGNYSRFTGTQLTLGGPTGGAANTTSGQQAASTISGYTDLPNGIISSKTNLTVEVWATPSTARNFARVFDFGRVAGTGYGGGAPGEIIDSETIPGATASSDSIELTFGVGTNYNQPYAEARLDGANAVTIGSALATTLGAQYHYVFTFEDGVGSYGSSGGRMKWYRDGTWVGSGDLAFHLSSVEDVNNWLGRSQWTADSNSNANYNELRLYNHALTPAEISANFAAGPDTIPPPPVAVRTPDHVWTFTEQASSMVTSGKIFTDSVSGMVATLRGNFCSLTDTSVVFPGTTTGNQTAAGIAAYLDLPNDVISAQPSISVEAWATPISSKNYQRLFDLGRCSATSGTGAATGEIIDGPLAPGNFAGYDNLVLSMNVGANLGTHRLEGQITNNPAVFSDTTAPTAAGTQYHYVLTVTDGAGTYGADGCQAKWYRDGSLQNTFNLAFRLTAMADVNNWIGRSQYGGDSNSNLSLNELRIYNRAITAGEIAASYYAGPDPSTGPPQNLPPVPIPENRWSFNAEAGPAPVGTIFTDVGTGEIATVRGNGATTTGTTLLLPSTTTTGNQTAAAISAYLDLPNGFVS